MLHSLQHASRVLLFVMGNTNGNGIVDLDGTFVTKPVFATDTVTLVVNLSQPASVTADLSKFALTNAEIIPVTTSASGFS